MVAFAERCANKIELQRLVYYDIRERFGLSSQMTIRAISKVSEAYKRDKHDSATLPPAWRDGLRPAHLLASPAPDRASLLTLDGRVEVPFRFGAYARGCCNARAGRQICSTATDTFFLAITVDAPEPTPDAMTDDFVGVDLGIIKLATTSGRRVPEPLDRSQSTPM